MARPKKSEEQPKADSTSLQISIEDFVRTRDSTQTMAERSRHLTREGVAGARQSLKLLTLGHCNICERVAQSARDIVQGAIDEGQAHLTILKVVTGLATLQSAVQDLSRAYIAHTNTVLGKGAGSSLELLNFANPLVGENGLFNSGRVATPAPAPEQGEVKKRKRAPHDKNAPKRPVTPYFLYMSFAREGIAKSMGSGAKAKEVADEGTRRWNTMNDEEKHLWQEKYAVNYAAYREKVKAYKAGQPIPDFTNDEKQRLYDQQRKAGATPVPIPETTSDHDEKSSSDEEEGSETTSSDEASPEPPKAVSPPKAPRASKRGKGAKEKAEKKVTPIKEASPAAKTPETDQKKKTSKKRDARALDGVPEPKKEAQAEIASSPAKLKKESEPKPKRKKRKSEVIDV
ncbi:MAG: hypothetical protein L6R39_002995 [Caloplaca ligustica]|nr:MAG: hypothetical protein L6R39_002995 [Caloplaca ligustica]